MKIEEAKRDYFKRISDRTEGRLSAAKVKPTMIKIDGVLFFTEKGKSLWKTPGHAKSALRNDINNYFYFANYRQRIMGYDEQKTLTDEIIANAEYVSIKLTDEMLANLKF